MEAALTCPCPPTKGPGMPGGPGGPIGPVAPVAPAPVAPIPPVAPGRPGLPRAPASPGIPAKKRYSLQGCHGTWNLVLHLSRPGKQEIYLKRLEI